jgi:hypothetical protein
VKERWGIGRPQETLFPEVWQYRFFHILFDWIFGWWEAALGSGLTLAQIPAGQTQFSISSFYRSFERFFACFHVVLNLIYNCSFLLSPAG